MNKGLHTGFYLSNEEAFVPKNEVLYDYTKKRHIHVNTGSVVETYQETNYLFSLGKYKEELKTILEKDLEVTKKFRSQVLAEWKNLPEAMSVSRPQTRIPWGVPVPNDDQTIYVWVDALINYYTALGYPDKDPNSNPGFCNMAHVLGKDILRFHALFWPALLLANKYPVPKRLVIHNFWLLKKVRCFERKIDENV